MPRSGLARLVAWLLSALALGCSHTPYAPKGRPVPYQGRFITFPTGMRLVVYERPEMVGVTFAASYRAGSTEDPAGKEGMAHLVEHLAFRGRQRGPGTARLGDRLRSTGMSFQAATTQDHTDYWELGAADQLREMLSAEADRLSAPLAGITENDFLAERDAVASELLQRFESYDGLAQLEWLLEYGLAGHVYGRPLAGTRESLSRITLADARAWVREHYTPAHVVLVLSSPLPTLQASAAVQSSFGTLASGDAGLPVAPVERVPPRLPVDRPEPLPLAVHRAPVERPQLWVGWTLPGDYSREIGRALVAEEALEARIHEGLRRMARDDRPEAVHVGLHRMDGVSLLYARVDLRHAEDAEEAFKRVRKSLWKIRDQRWVTTLRDAILGRAYLATEQLDAPAAAQFLRATGMHDYLDGWQKIIAVQLSAGSTDYLEKYVAPERAFSVVVVPDRNVTARSMVSFSASAREDVMHEDEEDGESAPPPPPQIDLLAIAGRPRLDDVEARTLPNGLRVVVARRGTLPIVESRLVFRTQAEGVPEVAPGLPQLALGIACGTAAWTDVLRIGASEFSSQGAESYVHGERGSSGNLPVILETLGRWARQVHACGGFEDLRRAYAREVEVAERRPAERARRVLRERLFPGHAYGKNPEPASLASLRSGDADRWFVEQIRPQRATLLLVSDVAPEPDMWKAIEDEFGGWSSGRPPPSDALEMPPLPSRRTIVLLDRPGATQALINVGYRRPLRAEEDRVAMEAVEWALESQLNRSLRMEQGVTYGVHVFGLEHDLTSALVVSTAVEQNACARSLSTILAAPRQVADQGVPGTLAQSARLQLARAFARRFVTVRGAASGLQEIALRGLPPDYWERAPASIASLSSERIQASGRSLSIGKEVIVIVGDRSVVLPRLQSAGFQVEVLPEPAPASPEKP